MKKRTDKWLNTNIVIVLCLLTIFIQIIRYDLGEFSAWLTLGCLVVMIAVEINDRNQP